ncbi:MAG: NPCBM/NEW2 domain-containing protein [Planctomycetota bacterium]|jgi:hypothetical protein
MPTTGRTTSKGHQLPALAVIVFSGILSGCHAPAKPFHTEIAGPVSDWPRLIPMRMEPAGRDELTVATLGNVSTPLADGTFDPVHDRVTLANGTIIPDYYKKQLDVPFFTPLDKSIFPVPPSGWCSWYYYYQEITAEEVLANARWIARHLASYGARYVQIDDGWQGVGHGLGDNRDWTTIDKRFKVPGMKGLASSIQSMGLEAGLWLAPHGQSNEKVARDSGAFLFEADGSSASRTWEGDFLVDPSAPRTLEYLRNLFTNLRDWGYSYFKIDGQPIVLTEYERTMGLIDSDTTSSDSTTSDDTARLAAMHYRETLNTIRDAIGKESYLLGCWGIPLAGAGIFNGSRTAGDIFPGWAGFLVANDAIQQWNFLHNITWYCDPDVLVVRPPLTMGMARAWATIQGLSGQALLTSDRLPDLPPARVEILKRVYPAVDIRPLDLFRPKNPRKPIWDLKIAHHLGAADDTANLRSYDVVGLFNFSDRLAENRHISWESLGLDAEQRYHVYDFWQQTYLGSWAKGVFLEIAPADVRVITLVPEENRPVLVSTSRHITQGWVDLLDLNYGLKRGLPCLRGRSRVIGGDPYSLTIGLPRAGPTFGLRSVKAKGVHPVKTAFGSQQGFATVELRSERTQEVSWELLFEPVTPYVFPVKGIFDVHVRPRELDGVEVSWHVGFESRSAYEILVDDQSLGVAFHTRAVIRNVKPGRTIRIGVRSIWSDGTASAKTTEIAHTQPLPGSVHVSDMNPVVSHQDWGSLARDRSVDGNPLQVGGARFEKGLGTHAASRLDFAIFGAYQRFEAEVGIDDEIQSTEPVEVEFQVWGDGEMLWSSGMVKSGQPARPVSVDITGRQILGLRVEPGKDGIDYDHADWLNARVLTTASSNTEDATPLP